MGTVSSDSFIFCSTSHTSFYVIKFVIFSFSLCNDDIAVAITLNFSSDVRVQRSHSFKGDTFNETSFLSSHIFPDICVVAFKFMSLYIH